MSTLQIRDKPKWLDLGVKPELPPPAPAAPSTKPKIMVALDKIRDAGFTVEMKEDQLVVEPKERLTPTQVVWLNTHQEKIRMTVCAIQDTNVREMIELFDAEVMSLG